MNLTRILAPLALFALLGASCGGSEAQPASTPDAASTANVAPATQAPCSPARPRAAGVARESRVTGAEAREYLLHIPQGYDGASSTPLVFLLHGYASDPDFIYRYTRMGGAADALGFVLVTPQGAGEEPHWNAQATPGDTDDVAFVDALLAEIEQKLCIDARRVHVAGYSNGGSMAQRLACALPDRFASIGTVASPSIACRVGVPLIAFHGTADPLVPFEGGGPGAPGAPPGPPVRRSVSEWARASGCDGLPGISRYSSEVEVSTFRRCAGADGDVLLYAVLSGGHSWPGADDIPLVGFTTHQVDASRTMLEFFLGHPLGR